jgi:hypothetical protein
MLGDTIAVASELFIELRGVEVAAVVKKKLRFGTSDSKVGREFEVDPVAAAVRSAWVS